MGCINFLLEEIEPVGSAQSNEWSVPEKRRYVMHRSTMTDRIEDTENNSRNKGALFMKVPLVLDILCGVEMVV